jgi:hypothetical protein
MQQQDIQHEFVPIDGGIDNMLENNRGKATSILKNGQVRYGDALKINPRRHRSDTIVKERVEPILKDDRLVGLRFICRCGNVAEIDFEFDQQTSEQ